MSDQNELRDRIRAVVARAWSMQADEEGSLWVNLEGGLAVDELADVLCAELEQAGIVHVDPLEGDGNVEHFVANGRPVHFWRGGLHECSDRCDAVYRLRPKEADTA